MASAVTEPMIHEVNVTEARKVISKLFDETMNEGRPISVTRDKKDESLFIGREVVRKLLERYEFHVNITPHEDEKGFTLWVPELKVVADGPSAREARESLVAAVRSYVLDYFQQFDFYKHLTDKLEQHPYVLRLSLARDDDELLEILFGRKPAKQSSPAAA